LRQKQIDCYAEEGLDWQAVAHQHVFPFLSDRLPAMQIARDNLLRVCEEVNGRYQQIFDLNNELICLIYVGIGCGAGWVTTYDDKPAILFGLENIAEEGWQGVEALTGVMAHELGHVTHFHWRQQAGLADGEGPWWQLYCEGFAQWCEHLILGKPTWHMQTAVGEQWQVWCQNNLSWLASEFLRRVACGEDIRPFFGSWFDLQGYKQTGYYLGHELIKVMQQQASLPEIATLEEIGTTIRPFLVEIAANKS
jgi:hypothetical protein